MISVARGNGPGGSDWRKARGPWDGGGTRLPLSDLFCLVELGRLLGGPVGAKIRVQLVSRLQDRLLGGGVGEECRVQDLLLLDRERRLGALLLDRLDEQLRAVEGHRGEVGVVARGGTAGEERLKLRDGANDQ